mmetsp:Transcript_14534/g.46205  ORF Transcript_14534/g.46205 Transcript_14534/m.46205 type:complete len:85 (-) Transcript_14534:1-255(-)
MADGSSRLYAMPFGDPECGVVVEDVDLSAATRAAVEGGGAHSDRTVMWQLSFPVEAEDEAKALCRDPDALAREAGRRVAGWASP